MKLHQSRYNKIDALSKLAGLVMLAFSIDNVSKGNYFIALLLFGAGGLVSIIPLFIEIETCA